MKTIKLLRNLAKFYPKRIAEKFHDHVGLQTGKLKEETKTIFLCLDFDEQVYEHLKKEQLFDKIDLIITHHPFIFGTKAQVFKYDENKRKLCELIDTKNIPVYSFHTNFDEGFDGMNDALAQKLNLKNIRPLAEDPMARCGELETEMEVKDFAKYAINKFDVDYALLINEGANIVKSVAIVGGGGWRSNYIAQKEGYDIFISGDIPHHGRRDVVSRKYNYLDMPHEIEKIFIDAMKTKLLEIDDSLNVLTLDHEKLPSVIIK